MKLNHRDDVHTHSTNRGTGTFSTFSCLHQFMGGSVRFSLFEIRKVSANGKQFLPVLYEYLFIIMPFCDSEISETKYSLENTTKRPNRCEKKKQLYDTEIFIHRPSFTYRVRSPVWLCIYVCRTIKSQLINGTTVTNTCNVWLTYRSGMRHNQAAILDFCFFNLK